jgi:hypothetical protein
VEKRNEKNKKILKWHHQRESEETAYDKHWKALLTFLILCVHAITSISIWISTLWCLLRVYKSEWVGERENDMKYQFNEWLYLLSCTQPRVKRKVHEMKKLSHFYKISLQSLSEMFSFLSLCDLFSIFPRDCAIVREKIMTNVRGFFSSPSCWNLRESESKLESHNL